MFGDVTDVLAQYNGATGANSGNEAFLEGMNNFAIQVKIAFKAFYWLIVSLHCYISDFSRGSRHPRDPLYLCGGFQLFCRETSQENQE